MSTEKMLETLVEATEFSQLPVRHNEDNINTELAKQCPLQVSDELNLSLIHNVCF